MARNRCFASPQTIYWPADYGYVVDALKGVGPGGTAAPDAMYRFNTGPIVLAAAIGLANGRKREVGPNRQEISGDTFEGQRFGNSQSSLAAFVLLVGLAAAKDVDMLRPEREGELVRTFERYVAGGLEYLAGALAASSDVSGQAVMNAEAIRALAALDLADIEGATGQL